MTLLKALTFVNQVIPAKSAQPCFTNFLLVADGNTLSISGSNGDISAFAVVDNFPSQPFSCQAPASLFLSIVSKLDLSSISFSLKNNSLNITDGISKFNIKTQSAQEFPSIDFSTGPSAFSIPSSDFQKLFDFVSFAAASKSPNELYTGIHVSKYANGFVSFLATDTYRLAKHQILTSPSNEDISFTAPKIALSMVSKFFDEGDIAISLSQNLAVFSSNSCVLTTRLYNGQFPNIVVPELPISVSLLSADFLSAADRVKIVSTNSFVKLSLSPNGVTLSSSSAAGDSSISLSSQNCSNEFVIGFNIDFLVDAIKALSSDTIVLSFKSPTSFFTVADPNNVDSNSYQIITPIRIRG